MDEIMHVKINNKNQICRYVINMFSNKYIQNQDIINCTRLYII